MKIKILETRDFRGTLGLRRAGEIVEIEDTILVKQLEEQKLGMKLTSIINKPKEIIKEG